MFKMMRGHRLPINRCDEHNKLFVLQLNASVLLKEHVSFRISIIEGMSLMCPPGGWIAVKTVFAESCSNVAQRRGLHRQAETGMVSLL